MHVPQYRNTVWRFPLVISFIIYNLSWLYPPPLPTHWHAIYVGCDDVTYPSLRTLKQLLWLSRMILSLNINHIAIWIWLFSFLSIFYLVILTVWFIYLFLLLFFVCFIILFFFLFLRIVFFLLVKRQPDTSSLLIQATQLCLNEWVETPM